MGLIYKAIFPNGKVYIGKTVKSLGSRISEHKSQWTTQQYKSKLFRAFNKYGFESVRWDILQQDIPDNILNLAEICAIYLCDSYYDGYNSTLGGEGATGRILSAQSRKKMSESRTGSKHSEDTKTKMSLAHKGKVFSSETRAKLSKANTGKKRTEEMKKAMSERVSGKNHPFYGKHRSEETKRKIGEKNKISLLGKVPWNVGLKATDKIRENMALAHGARLFEVFNSEGVFVGSWINQSKCAEDLGLNSKRICDYLKQRRKCPKGYIFRYIQDISQMINEANE